jgi:hypothetical protein
VALISSEQDKPGLATFQRAGVKHEVPQTVEVAVGLKPQFGLPHLGFCSMEVKVTDAPFVLKPATPLSAEQISISPPSQPWNVGRILLIPLTLITMCLVGLVRAFGSESLAVHATQEPDSQTDPQGVVLCGPIVIDNAGDIAPLIRGRKGILYFRAGIFSNGKTTLTVDPASVRVFDGVANEAQLCHSSGRIPSRQVLEMAATK